MTHRVWTPEDTQRLLDTQLSPQQERTLNITHGGAASRDSRFWEPLALATGRALTMGKPPTMIEQGRESIAGMQAYLALADEFYDYRSKPQTTYTAPWPIDLTVKLPTCGAWPYRDQPVYPDKGRHGGWETSTPKQILRDIRRTARL